MHMNQLLSSHLFWAQGPINPSLSPGSLFRAESKHQDKEEEKKAAPPPPMSQVSSQQPSILILSNGGKNGHKRYKTKDCSPDCLAM